jgi:Lipoprotein amino terminal region
MCGSNPSFLLIKNWIETGVIKGEEAAQVIAAVPSYILKPSRLLLEKYFELVRASQDQKVVPALVTSFSHLLRVTCADQQDKVSVTVKLRIRPYNLFCSTFSSRSASLRSKSTSAI